MAANDMIKKDYTGAAVATTLNGAIAGGATSIVLTNGSTYPDGSGGKFVICIDRGLGTEEKILITSRSGNTLTVSDRGYDGSSAQAHSNAAAVEHVLDAFSIKQANALANLLTTKGDLFVMTAAGVVRVPIGTNGQRLLADSAQTPGVRWADETELQLFDAKGDLLIGSADNTAIRKPVGADGLVLVADAASAGGVKWGLPSLTPVASTPAMTWGGGVVDTISASSIQIGHLLHFVINFRIFSGSGSFLLTMAIPGGLTASQAGYAQVVAVASGNPVGTVACALGGTTLSAVCSIIAGTSNFASGTIQVA